MRSARLHATTRGTTHRFEVTEGSPATLGRSSACTVRILDERVSRQHCRVEWDQGKLVATDLQSSHGVVHRAQRVQRLELEAGTSFHIGQTLVVVDSVDEVAAPVPAAEPEAAVAARDAAELAPESQAVAGGRIGTVVGGCRILSLLGAGGFGTVYRAQQLQLGREVALKVLRRTGESGHDPMRVEAFLREARTAAALHDPRFVQVFEAGEDGGEYYLVMELVPGGTLARRLKTGGRMSWEQLLPVLRDVAGALQAAHEQGIVHRDVKPANILLTADGRAKLGDLGLADDGSRVGTVAFMAPEQLRNEPLDARADLYALGCTAYAALAGRVPFTGSTRDMARGHLRETPPLLEELGVEVPLPVEELVVDGLMARDRADRVPSAAELLRRLDALERPRPPVPQRTEEAAATHPPRRRRPVTPKGLLARFLAELIVFSIVLVLVIVMLFVVKMRWPELSLDEIFERMRPR
ncbi:MAG: hypothetical protein RL148_67 [Planctomycetota bacterium]